MPEWQTVEEFQLIQEAQCGNAEAFGELYERYAPSIFRFLYAHLSDRLDAEDLTEEVFLRTWRSLGGYKEKGLPFRAFLYRIAHNLLVDFYRSSKRTLLVEDADENILRDEQAESGTLAAANLEHQELRQTLQNLRADYQTVLVARFLADMSPDETASLMGKSVGAVRVLQHRALLALRKLIEKQKDIENV